MIVDYSKKIVFENITEFENFVSKQEYPLLPIIKSLKFNIKMNLDFFTIRFFENGGNFGIVSENLKNEIEKQNISGMEFRPIEISFQDWLRSEEREKIYGKIY